MTYSDLRLVEIQQRDGMAFGIKETVGTLVGGGILMMVGLYAYSKVGQKIDTSNFTADELTAYNNVKSNVTSGFDLMSLVFIILAIVTFIGVLFIAFR